MQDVPSRESTDLAVIKVLKADMVYVPGGVDAILKKIADEVRAHKPDISTEAGRAAIASLAYKVARSKTALDDMGRDLVADWKHKAAAVDADRRKVRAGLDALKEEVRKPLTEWEQADIRRIEEHEKAIADIMALLDFAGEEPSSAKIQHRIDLLEARPARAWEEFVQRASEAASMVGARLEQMLAAAIKRQSEAVELERLRAEKIAREQKERDERIAAEAADRARLEAERKAQREAEEARIEVEAERIRAQQALRELTVRAEQAERAKHAAIEAERKRVADEKAAQAMLDKKREENKKHRTRIHDEITAALIEAEFSVETARAFVAVLAAGEVPHVKISY